MKRMTSEWMRAKMSFSGRPLGFVTLSQGEVAVDVVDPTHKARLEKVFRETSDFTYAWTRRGDAPEKPAVAPANTQKWLHAILLLKLHPEGYRFTITSRDEDTP